MKNLDIDKISKRLFEISGYGMNTYSGPKSDEKDLFFDEEEVMNEQDEVSPEDQALSKELESLTSTETTPTEGAPVESSPVETPAPVGSTPTDVATVEPPVEAPVDSTSPSGETIPTEAPIETGDTSTVEETGDEVKVDVSDIVSGVENTESSVQSMEQKIDDVGSKFNDYIEKLMKTNDTLMSKIGELENSMKKELKKRNPTPLEQLQLRSMSSYPYTQKLSDFWEDNGNGSYSPKPKTENEENEDETPKEYTLTQKDLEDSFSINDIKKTF